MLDGPAIADALQTCGITHVVWIPDSFIGTWQGALLQSPSIQLVRPTREGEAIAIAGGLLLGGARPIVMIQCTGLFEAGDALRNIIHDLNLPMILIVGIRSYLAHRAGKSKDNCAIFTEPILKAWNVPYEVLDPGRHDARDLIAAVRISQRSGRAGAILIAE